MSAPEPQGRLQAARRASRRALEGGHGLAVALGTVVFLSSLAAGAEPLKVAVLSDLNGAYGSSEYGALVDAAVVRVVELRPALVLITGDMVAGQRRPALSRSELEAMWRAFHLHVSDPLTAAGIALAVTPGNHDASGYPGFELEREVFREQWQQRAPVPNLLPGSRYPFDYAFTLDGVLFVALDATVGGELSDARIAWLRDVLLRQGGMARQTIVLSHLPLLPFAQGREREFLGDERLASLLREATVSLYLSGHHHAFYPGYRDGVTYVSQACLGGGPRILLGGHDRSPQGFTLLDVGTDVVEVSALSAPDFAAADWRSLPERLGAGTMEMVRADLAAGSRVRPATAVAATGGGDR